MFVPRARSLALLAYLLAHAQLHCLLASSVLVTPLTRSALLCYVPLYIRFAITLFLPCHAPILLRSIARLLINKVVHERATAAYAAQ